VASSAVANVCTTPWLASTKPSRTASGRLPSQDFYDFQLFAPPDLQEYEIYPEPSEGIFFNYDRLYWGITPPRVSGVGTTQTGNYIIPTYPLSPQTIVQLNNDNIAASGTSGVGSIIGGLYTYGSDPLRLDLNTSWMRTKMAWGNRYEGGWIYDNRGVLLTYTDLGSQSQSFQTNSEFAASSPTQTFTQNVTINATSLALHAITSPQLVTESEGGGDASRKLSAAGSASRGDC
jgi:hypothetical protein